MKRTWTIIGVDNVARSYEWYQLLFGQPKSAPAHDYFGQIVDDDGTVLLCLHQWGDQPSSIQRRQEQAMACYYSFVWMTLTRRLPAQEH
jgi:hypothetical protein